MLELLAGLLRALFGLFRPAVPEQQEPDEPPSGTEGPGMDFVRNESEQITAHFNAAEFTCIDKSETFRISRRLVNHLESFRQRLGRPLSINSGYRTTAHNTAIKAVPGSLHTKGMAADASPPDGMTLAEFHRAARAYWLNGQLGGLGFYSWGCHFDVGRVKTWGESAG